MTKRTLTEIDKRVLWKFAWNCGYKGIRSIQKFKKRLKKGICFPPFIYMSITSACQLRCQGCWVDVDRPRQHISLNDLNALINEAKEYGNSLFGLLGGEPLLHPQFFEIIESHRDCCFQVFTNGHMITEDVAQRLRKAANVTPMISIEGNETISNQRRGRLNVLNRTLTGLEHCRNAGLITGVATSVCQNNLDLVTEDWLRQLIEMGVHYVWFYTYRPVGPKPRPELSLTPKQSLQIRRFIVEMRSKLPIAIIDAYWDDQGRALCPMAMGISHHIGPGGHIEPCPIIQFAKETIRDEGGIYELLTQSEFLKDFRETAAKATRGCILLERPDLMQQLIKKHNAIDTTQRQTGLAELAAMTPRHSQHHPAGEIPEENWMYRFAKKHWFFGFGAYT